MRLIADYHTHTVYSHGKHTVEDNVLAAISCGLKRVAITDHGPAHRFYGVNPNDILKQKEEIVRLKRKYENKIELLFGLEANLTGFCECDVPNGVSFDVLMLGYHKGIFPKDAFTRRAAAEALFKIKNSPIENANALLATAEKYRIKILSHPNEYIAVDIPTLARGARELGVFIEINSSHLSLDVKDIQIAKTHGAKFVFGSDAHKKENVGNVTNAADLAIKANALECIDNIII